MAVSPEIKAAVEAAHGKESARDLAERYGLTRNQVVGLWHRRPRDMPGEPAKADASVAAVDTAVPDPIDPKPAPFVRRQRTACSDKGAASLLASSPIAVVPNPAPAAKPQPAAVIDVEPAAAAAVGPVVSATAVPRTRDELAMPSNLSGAAAAIANLRRGCCRWPIGEPNDHAFRFCGEAVQDEGKPYCAEHRRVGSAGQWSARRAA